MFSHRFRKQNSTTVKQVDIRATLNCVDLESDHRNIFMTYREHSGRMQSDVCRQSSAASAGRSPRCSRRSEFKFGTHFFIDTFGEVNNLLPLENNDAFEAHVVLITNVN
ncbi:hypothetical protein O0L34_g8191 [Tuta absoluta]|nr:hypothetical protein O0L34_g8191 [Tuta absoluta]